MPGLHRQSSDNRQPPPIYIIPLKAYPALFVGREDLEPGNKGNKVPSPLLISSLAPS
jgi:hypothetical protein